MTYGFPDLDFNDDEEDRLATEDDAMREYAGNVGRERRDIAWILTDYDVWVANPFYNGPPQPHPESGYDGSDYDSMEEQL